MGNEDRNLIDVEEFRFIRLVRDLKTQRVFYETIFNWPIKEEWSHGVMYDTGVSTFELIEDQNVDMPNVATSFSRVSLKVPDIQSLFEKLKDKVKIIFPPRDNSWGDRSFRISDPEGFPITFFTPNKP